MFLKFLTNELLAFRDRSSASSCFFLCDLMLEIGCIVQMSLNSESFYPFLISILSKIHLHRNEGNHKQVSCVHVYNVDMKKHYNYTLYVREVNFVIIIVFQICVKKKEKLSLTFTKKNLSRPYDGLCRILFLNDTEAANIIVLHV